MSELTSCNYCSLLGIKDRYGPDNVRLQPAHVTRRSLGGIDVEVLKDGTWEFEAWFMELSAHCVC